MSLLWSRSSRGIRWSVATAQRAREIALAGSDMLMRARVAGRSPDAIRNVGACCVRLELLGTKLQPGGWTVGLRAPSARGDGFVAAIGGAPGDHRRGILDALVMARHCEGGDQVTFLGEDALERWLPLGAVVEISPIWQETDFFDLHRQFRAIDTDGSGEIDAAEVGQLLRRVLGEEPSEEQVAEVLSAADRDGSGTIDYGEFCERAFFEARPRFAEMGPDDGREALL